MLVSIASLAGGRTPIPYISNTFLPGISKHFKQISRVRCERGILLKIEAQKGYVICPVSYKKSDRAENSSYFVVLSMEPIVVGPDFLKSTTPTVGVRLLDRFSSYLRTGISG